MTAQNHTERALILLREARQALLDASKLAPGSEYDLRAFAAEIQGIIASDGSEVGLAAFLRAGIAR